MGTPVASCTDKVVNCEHSAAINNVIIVKIVMPVIHILGGWPILSSGGGGDECVDWPGWAMAWALVSSIRAPWVGLCTLVVLVVLATALPMFITGGMAGGWVEPLAVPVNMGLPVEASPHHCLVGM